MSSDDIDLRLLRHYASARTSWGRWRLNFHFWLKCFVWRWQTHGGRVAKRAFDLAVSLTLLAFLSPLFLLIGLLVKLEDDGPVFFAQTRVGQFGREFKMFKIRSMCLNAEERLQDLMAQNRHSEGVTFKIKNDPRITTVGRWLRMSLVGPRPPLPREVNLYSLADRRRLAALPGVTCFWQISGRSEIGFVGQVKLDLNYIECQSFWVDVKILARTVPAVISGKGAC
jgi:lipopolysaccharide/colanic/teichoic acid biosynthesis glycosyltransferase